MRPATPGRSAATRSAGTFRHPAGTAAAAGPQVGTARPAYATRSGHRAPAARDAPRPATPAPTTRHAPVPATPAAHNAAGDNGSPAGPAPQPAPRTPLRLCCLRCPPLPHPRTSRAAERRAGPPAGHRPGPEPWGAAREGPETARPRAGGAPRSRLGLIGPGLGVSSSARLADRLPRMADCPGCSVECRCCAPPAGRTGSESHSTRRPCVGRTYGNLPGSVGGALTRHPVGSAADPEGSCGSPGTAGPGPFPLGWDLLYGRSA